MEDLTTRVNNLEERLDQQIATLCEELTRRFGELVVLVRNNQGGVSRNRRQHRAQYVEKKDDVEEHDLYAQLRRGHANGGDMFKIKDEIPTFNGNVNIEGFLDWIYEVETFFEIMNIPPERRVPFVAYKLKGGARAWWNCHQEELHFRGENHGCDETFNKRNKIEIKARASDKGDSLHTGGPDNQLAALSKLVQ
ncbi:hypothetical protein T459_30043 [Capsicum annuum]|uniref:Retrotransposon gag domain-containing protein n=1 Tax=Capsicum annuum TaxID=4072 RepID=A0A2G2Y7A0_CAPAN|nr:hypothetical protein T459_30043 [Capsicum annuum]